MARFFQLDRLTTTTTSHLKPIIFDGDAVLYAHVLKLYDKEQGIPFNATEVSVLGYPEYTFRTLVTLANLSVALGGGTLLPGFPFVGDPSCSVPGGPVLVSIDGRLPQLLVRRVINRIKSTTESVMLNPNYIVYVETQTYQDEDTEVETSGALIVLNSTPPKQVPTNLSFAEVSAFLEPTIIV